MSNSPSKEELTALSDLKLCLNRYALNKKHLVEYEILLEEKKELLFPAEIQKDVFGMRLSKFFKLIPNDLKAMSGEMLKNIFKPLALILQEQYPDIPNKTLTVLYFIYRYHICAEHSAIFAIIFDDLSLIDKLFVVDKKIVLNEIYKNKTRDNSDQFISALFEHIKKSDGSSTNLGDRLNILMDTLPTMTQEQKEYIFNELDKTIQLSQQVYFKNFLEKQKSK